MMIHRSPKQSPLVSREGFLLSPALLVQSPTRGVRRDGDDDDEEENMYLRFMLMLLVVQIDAKCVGLFV